jgi:hypothetical protein
VQCCEPSQRVPDFLPTPFATMADRQRLISVILVISGMLCASGIFLAQTQTADQIHVEPDQVQEPIRVRSNLVLVPTFVYWKGRIQALPAEDWKCVYNQIKLFSGWSRSEPFSGELCNSAVVTGLTPGDFTVLDNGIPARIESITVEDSFWSTRDNLGWHVDTAVTPGGYWSSEELSQHRFGGNQRIPLYVVAFVPPDSQGTGCHKIEVRVDRPGVQVFARDEYCPGQSISDPLFGTTTDKRLQADLASRELGKAWTPVFVQWGIFFAGPSAARVQITLGFHRELLYREWNASDSSLWARVAVLGVVNKKAGGIAARFSDMLYPPGWSVPIFSDGHRLSRAELAEYDPVWLPERYSTQVDLPTGQYNLKVALDDTQKFDRVEVPLDIPAWDGKTLALSSVMICKQFRNAHVVEVERKVANFAPRYVPLVSRDMEVTPVSEPYFVKWRKEPVIAYFEVYEPPLSAQPETKVEAHIRILNAKTGAVVKEFPPVDAAPFETPGSWKIPIAYDIPLKELRMSRFRGGEYKLEVWATDSAGRSTEVHTAEIIKIY